MAKILQKWEPDRLVGTVKTQLADNGELVGKFVEGDARKRLDAIRTPDDDRSIRWRRFLSKWVLTHTVDVETRSVEICVGMKRAPNKGGDTRGLYVELGSRGVPAHPYLRPAVFQNMRQIVQLLTGK